MIRTDLPPDSHPDAVVMGVEGNSRDRIHRAAKAMYENYGKVADLAAQVKDKAVLAAKAQPFIERTIAQADKTLLSIQQEAAAAQAELDTAFKGGDTDAVGAEIRAYIAQQNSGQMTALDILTKDNDLRTAQAVLSAPAYLSGMTTKQQNEFRDHAERRLFPEQSKQRDGLQRAAIRFERAQVVFTERMTKNMRGWQNKDADIIGKELSTNEE